MHRIFVEGRETAFIEFLLSKIHGDNHKDNFLVINTGGWQKLDRLQIEFAKSTDDGFKNLIIFDADSPENGGGFTTRSKAITGLCKKLNMVQELFLFPNNSLDGDFESLLENVINSSNKSIIDCFTAYENCVSSIKNSDGSNRFKLPIRKAKMYSYVDAFPKSNKKEEKFKRGDWFFDDDQIWNIDNNDFIKPLFEFLKIT
jgi:hypothetical protein